ncbi:DUF4276 family protein [Aeromonas caviae]|nr:DUF4276 family protein [Aeromonas caviae]
MKELVFMLEEPSAKAMLESVLPRFLDDTITTRIFYFEGKQDLEKNVVRKIQLYQNPNARFIVIRDQDSQPNCMVTKNKLLDLCKKTGKSHHCLVRIACRELETIYLADLQAVEKGLDIKNINKLQETKKFRSPDQLENPKKELKVLTNNKYQNISGSREIGKHLDLNNTRSPTFKNILGAVKKWEADLLSV